MDSIEEPYSIYHDEQNFILYMGWQFSEIGVLHSYDFSFLKTRPRVWKKFNNKSFQVDAVYQVKLGKYRKILSRPNVAAIVG